MSSALTTPATKSRDTTGSELPREALSALIGLTVATIVASVIADAKSGALTQTITPPDSDDDFDNEHPIDGDDPVERYLDAEFDE